MMTSEAGLGSRSPPELALGPPCSSFLHFQGPRSGPCSDHHTPQLLASFPPHASPSPLMLTAACSSSSPFPSLN